MKIFCKKVNSAQPEHTPGQTRILSETFGLFEINFKRVEFSCILGDESAEENNKSHSSTGRKTQAPVLNEANLRCMLHRSGI